MDVYHTLKKQMIQLLGVWLFKDNNWYILIFSDNFTDEHIKDLISTIIID